MWISKRTRRQPRSPTAARARTICAPSTSRTRRAAGTSTAGGRSPAASSRARHGTSASRRAGRTTSPGASRATTGASRTGAQARPAYTSSCRARGTTRRTASTRPTTRAGPPWPRCGCGPTAATTTGSSRSQARVRNEAAAAREDAPRRPVVAAGFPALGPLPYLLQAAIFAVSVPAARTQFWSFCARSIDGCACWN